MTKLIAIALVFASACVADEPSLPGQLAADLDLDALDVTSEAGAAQIDVEAPPPSLDSGRALCEHVVTDDPACKLSCEPERMIEQYVPKGTCVLFKCELDDGSIFNLGGCND